MEDAGSESGWTEMSVVGQFEAVLKGRGFSRRRDVFFKLGPDTGHRFDHWTASERQWCESTDWIRTNKS